MYKIVTDSSCDILDYPGVNFTAVPLTISTAERTFIDDRDLDCHEMLDYLANYKGRSYTACPSSGQWLKAFEGADEVYVITLTGGLSGTYNSACVAAEQYKEAHPEVKICLFDSLTTGPEMCLLIEKIVELKEAGKSMEDIQTAFYEYREKTHLYFSFLSLHNFAQNGRINKLLAASIGMLGISIIGTASKEGVIEPINKCRGEKKVILQIINAMVKDGFTGGKIRISEIENKGLAKKLYDAFRTHFPNADVKIYPARGICCYYAERGGVIIGCEC